MVGLGELTLGVGLWYASYKAEQAIVITGVLLLYMKEKLLLPLLHREAFLWFMVLGELQGYIIRKLKMK